MASVTEERWKARSDTEPGKKSRIGDDLPDHEYERYVRLIFESEEAYEADNLVHYWVDRTGTLLNPLARLAIRQFNKKEKAKYKFVKLEKAVGMILVYGLDYYITFQAKSAKTAHQEVTFQAIVTRFSRMKENGNDEKVRFCRLKDNSPLQPGTIRFDKSVCELNNRADDEDNMPRNVYEVYDRQVNKSEGFDVANFSPYFTHFMVKPMRLTTYYLKLSTTLANLALDQYNQTEDANYELVKVEKINTQWICAFDYFITFEAKDANRGQKTFQARLRTTPGSEKDEVILVRLKIPPTEMQGIEHLQPGQEITCS